MFLIAMLMIDHFMNKGNTDITAEMPKATYPLVYVMEENKKSGGGVMSLKLK